MIRSSRFFFSRKSRIADSSAYTEHGWYPDTRQPGHNGTAADSAPEPPRVSGEAQQFS